jgi:hypothetical protein
MAAAAACGGAEVPAAMAPQAPAIRATALPVAATLALLLLPACTSIGDLGRLQDAVVTDDIHAWVGQEAAVHAGAPVSLNNLTDDERTLRDLAFPLIEPPYDRQRWDAVVLEYGIKRSFRQALWTPDVPAYYAHLSGEFHRSSAARYNLLIDDMRNDIVRIEPFFEVARRVADIDRRREAALQHVTDVSVPERVSAQARIGENSLTMAWVYRSLLARCAGYRYALDHLVVGEPLPAAADADRILTGLAQQIASYKLMQPPYVAALQTPAVTK